MIKKYAAIVFLTFWMVGASAFAASYKYYIKIVAPAVPVYASASTSARALPAAKKDQLLEIVEKKDQWLRIKVTIAGGGFVYGWVEVSTTKYKIIKKTVIVEQPRDLPRKPSALAPLASTDNDVVGKTKTKPAAKRKTQDNEFRHGATYTYRAFLGPVYSIKDYFSSSGLSNFQYRFGIGVDRIINDKIWLSLPLMYAQGQGFKTLLGGINGYFAPLDLERWMPYAKLGGSFEYLFSGGNSFYGANVEAGLGVDYVLNDNIAFGIEPISIQAMVYRSEATIPMNIRGQLLLSVRFKW